MVMETATEMETVMVTEEQSPKQQSPKRNKDSSGWLERDQKGEMENPSPEVAKVAASAKRSDVKKFASTKHDKLPEKKKMEEETKYDAAKITTKRRKRLLRQTKCLVKLPIIGKMLVIS